MNCEEIRAELPEADNVAAQFFRLHRPPIPPLLAEIVETFWRRSESPALHMSHIS